VDSQRPLRVLLDQGLQHHAQIWADAGTPNAIFKLTPIELEILTEA
jgi:prolyl-tRNA editing enzyme YbaK/EbsC (Cys-tRNA(Pro) deacylase)|tara:strand:- start:179 stop:316 length:138 start_codon:yes stop_codon:yes gene_type:complete